MSTHNLLVELLVEELPPKALKKLGSAFADALSAHLKSFSLTTTHSQVTAFASPRRLAVHITDVLPKAPDQPITKKLMPRAIALDAAGKPTSALIKKAQATSELCSELVARWPDATNEKGKIFFQRDGNDEALFFETILPGTDIQLGLQFALNDVLGKLPIPKVMTYQLHTNCEQPGWSTVNFVRPVHGLVALLGADVVPVSVLGLEAGRVTRGHRFEATADTLSIRDADSYESRLENEGAVIPRFEKRRAEIERQLQAAAARERLTPVSDDALLDEVTALVERPNVLTGQFDTDFLAVPQECLILTMKANQKYFPLLDDRGKLTNKFLIVSNIRPQNARNIVSGNERVVRPRLADAKFFFDQDRKRTLASRVEGLRKVVYHNKLGTQGERAERVWAIAQSIGLKLGGDALAAQAGEAAMLAKADLLTDMVGEFPELQGIMGRYYAQHDGLSNDIAFAIEDHYKPRFAGDVLPRNTAGLCVALADKLETLAGLFGIGQTPTGDKDPFALRRHALGIIRILLEKKLPLDLRALIDLAFAGFPEGVLGSAQADLMAFIQDRLGGAMREQGYSANEVEAVLCLTPTLLHQVPEQLEAVRAFSALPEAASLAAANKRVGNILRKAGGPPGNRVDSRLLQEPAEQALHRALDEIAPRAQAAFDSGNYTASLQALAALKEPVDLFFDHVMVNTDDASLRANRFALLAKLQRSMNRVADISRLAT